MNRVVVIVTGEPGMGKTTVMQVVAEALEKVGIKVEIKSQDDGMPTIAGEGLQTLRVNALKKSKTYVELSEHRLFRQLTEAP